MLEKISQPKNIVNDLMSSENSIGNKWSNKFQINEEIPINANMIPLMAVRSLFIVENLFKIC